MSDMVHYYHYRLIQCLQKIRDYKSSRRSERTGEILETTEPVHSALVNLKSVVSASLESVPTLQPKGSSITLDQIGTLINELAKAQTEWTAKVGVAEMTQSTDPGNSWKMIIYAPAAGENNIVNYEVTREIEACLTLLRNLQGTIRENLPPSVHQDMKMAPMGDLRTLLDSLQHSI